MKYPRNPLMVELMVPRSAEVAARIDNFYEAIGWDALSSIDTDDPFTTYVSPHIPDRPAQEIPPTIMYWQTENPDKTHHFTNHDSDVPSPFARGLRLPSLQELVEICLVVPNDDAVHTIFERGGEVLEAHAHVLPREHAGSQEFRFADPFNYSLRVTANPGWQIRSHQRIREATGSAPLTTEVALRNTSETIEILTLDNLRNGSRLLLGAPNVGAMLNRLLVYSENVEQLERYLYLDESGRALGLRKDQLGALVAALKEHKKNKEGIGNELGPNAHELLERLNALLSAQQNPRE